MIQIRSLSKAFQSGSQQLQVLKNLELDLKEGSMLAVTGESGSGKSTFLHLLGGMEKPDQGQIRVGGQDIAQMSGKALASYRNRMIGFVFQFHHLLSEFSAVENVMFPLLLRGEAFGEARRQALQRLEEAGLADRATHRPGQMSGGEQQRVALARALIGRPRILLADEPTGDLDERTSEAIHQLLMGVHKSHALTSVIVTHNPRLSGLCGRQLCMREGKLQLP